MKKNEDRKSAAAPAAFPVSAQPLPWKRFAGVFLAGIPFFLTLPYTFHSWRISPMDSMNWIFHLAFLLLAACAAPSINDSVKELKRAGAAGNNVLLALLFVFVFALCYGFGVMRQIYMIRILGGTAFWWACLWLFCGWRPSCNLLPRLLPP